jgi:carbonic anhydrase
MFEDLRSANRAYASTFDLGALPARAAKGLGLLTCIDTRIEPLAALGLRPGDAKILRNAGGRVTDDVLRSFVLATNLLGVDRIGIMHHTDCALAGRSDEQLRSMITGPHARASEHWSLLGMPDPDAALVQDVSALRECGALPAGLEIQGWRYDVRTGLVHDVVIAEVN